MAQGLSSGLRLLSRRVVLLRALTFPAAGGPASTVGHPSMNFRNGYDKIHLAIITGAHREDRDVSGEITAA
jgi:hypothetical protein